jgi:hypothetical protein
MPKTGKRSQTSWWDEYVHIDEKRRGRRREGAPALDRHESHLETPRLPPAGRAARKAPPRPRPRPAPAPPKPGPKAKPKPPRAPAPKPRARPVAKPTKPKAEKTIHHPPCTECGHPQAAHAQDRPHLCARCLCKGYTATKRRSPKKGGRS